METLGSTYQSQVAVLQAENAQLKAELAKAKAREQRMRKAMELYKESSYQSHTGHWDRTGGHGAGCEECIRSIELRQKAKQALEEAGT